MTVEERLREEFDTACRDARPPAAGVVWFRAERRRRTEAARTAARPVTVAHAFAAACALGAAAALLQFLAPWLRHWVSAAGDFARLLQSEAMASLPTVALLGTAGLSLVAASLAVYVALLDD